MSSSKLILVDPKEIHFQNMEPGSVSQKPLRITNISQSTLNLTLKPISEERYKISPSEVKLKPNQKVYVDVQLKLKDHLTSKITQYSDYLLIKGAYLDQKVNIRVDVNPLSQNREDQGLKKSSRASKPPSRDPSLNARRKSREEILEEIEFEKKEVPKKSQTLLQSILVNEQTGVRQSTNLSASFGEKNTDLRQRNRFNRNNFEEESNSPSPQFHGFASNSSVKFATQFDEDRFAQSGLLEARNNELKTKIRQLEKELFEKDKLIHELKYSKNEMEIQIDELQGKYLDSDDELKRVRNLYDSLRKRSHSNGLRDTYMSEIKGLLERANPDIQKVANLAIKDLEIKLEEKYQEKLNKLDAERQRWEKERENENEKSRVRGSNMDSEFLGISNPKNFAGDTRQHVMKLEAKVSAFESLNRELNMKIDELEQKAEEYSAQQGDFFNTEKGLRSYISKNSTENAKKILANKNLSQEVDHLLNRVHELQDELQTQQDINRQYEVKQNQLRHKLDELLSQKNEDQTSYNELLQNFIRFEFNNSELVKRLDHIKITIHDILEYLEALEGGQEVEDQLSVRRKNFMENLDVFLSYEPLQELNQENFYRSASSNPTSKLQSSGNLSGTTAGLLQKERQRTMEMMERIQEMQDQINHYELELSQRLIESRNNQAIRAGIQDAQTEFEKFSAFKRSGVLTEATKLTHQDVEDASQSQSGLVRSQGEKIRQLEKQIQSLQEENRSLAENIRENSEREANVEHELEDLKLSLMDEEKRNVQLNNKLTKLKDNQDQLLRLDSLEEELKRKNKVIKSLNIELEDKDERIIKLSQEVASRNSIISELNTVMAEQKSKLDNFERSAADEQRKLKGLEEYKEELLNQNRSMIENYESRLQEANQQAQSSILRNSEIQMNYEQIQDVIAKYEMDVEKKAEQITKLKQDSSEAKKLIKKLSQELTDLRVNIDKKVKDNNDDTTKSKVEIRQLKAQITELEADRKLQEIGYREELSKMINLHSQTLSMLKSENNALDKRFEEEMKKRSEEQERWRQKELEFRSKIETANLANKKKQRTVGKRSSSCNRADDSDASFVTKDSTFKLEEELKKKEHKIIDLEAQISGLQQEMSSLRKRTSESEIKKNELENENQFLKSRNDVLKEEVKKIRVLDTIAEKTDLELVTELNDLREKVMDLKAERNRIIDQLTDNNLIGLGERREKEISTEAFLNYIKSLIVSKQQLATDMMERESEINDLVKQSLVSDQKLKSYEAIQNEFKSTLEDVKNQLKRSEELINQKNQQIIALSEQASRKEIESSAVMQELEIKTKHAQTDREKVFNTIAELKAQMKDMEEDCKQTLKFQEHIAEFERKRFVAAINEVKSACSASSKDNLSIIKDLLKKFMENTSMIGVKEAKAQILEKCSKKDKSKKNELEKENKVLKKSLCTALLEIDRIGKFQKASTSRTIAKNSAEETIIQLTETLRECGILDFNTSARLAEITDKASQNAGQFDVYQAEILAMSAKVRRKDKELQSLKEKLSVQNLELSEAIQSQKSLEKENKQLTKSMEKAQAMFRQEMEQLISKIQSSNELINLQSEKQTLTKKLQIAQARILELEQDLRQKEDSIESIRALKDTLERRIDEEKEENRELTLKLSKNDEKFKENTRLSQNLKLFKEKHETSKDELAKALAENQKLNQKLKDLKNDATNKETMIGQLKDKLEKQKGEKIPEANPDEVEELKKIIKRLKSEIERKDKLVESLQNKILSQAKDQEEQKDRFEDELEKHKNLAIQKRVENKKLKETSNEIAFKQQIIDALLMILRRVFLENLNAVYESMAKTTFSNAQTGMDFGQYSESMQILNMNETELSEFVGMKSKKNKNSDFQSRKEQELANFEHELQKKDDLDPHKIYEMVQEVINERSLRNL